MPRPDSRSAAGSPFSLHPPVPRLKDTRLGPIDAVWHVLNFFAPALGLGLLASLLAKLLWRDALHGVRWRRLSGWTSLACAGASIGGLIATGHDGAMATYAAMVLVCALTLWTVGFGPLRR